MNLETLQTVLLAASNERTQEGTLTALVQGLGREPGVALARIWLVKPGDICEECPLRSECPDQRRCLHLAASDGRSVKSGRIWPRLDGSFRRFPMGIRKIGKIAASGKPNIAEVSRNSKWLADPAWAEKEGIRCVAGHPLVVGDETIGVLAVFSRVGIGEEDFRSLHVFANHAATSIANARAYDEINRLRTQLQLENEYLRHEVIQALDFGDIIGTSPALRKVLQQVELVAPTEANVLIQGESGTGKELLARSIHDMSRRGGRPMIKVNCASVPKDLFESEFFGHVKGSFTGAIRDRVGRFELADGGTLFLDEVGEIPLDLQSKLLRVLQEGELERVGDTTSRKINVRVISATNRDLPEATKAGQFRQDLYYRLSVFPIEAPPLRARLEDVELLARHFVQTAAEKNGLPRINLTRKHLADLRTYDWPGNVRELQHVIERAVIMSSGGELDIMSLVPSPAADVPVTAGGLIPAAKLKQLEQESIRAALKKAAGKVYGAGGAADFLGVPPTTLASRMKALGIEKSGRAFS